jgi:predicted glycosyltransferase
MYSHDTYGLGHIRRTMAIASQLKSPCTNILILSGSPIVGRFDFPERIDFVRIPGMIKKDNEVYLPHTIRIDPDQAMSIRQAIITATAKTFQPDLFIVDKAPLGLKREIMPTLKMLKRSKHPCRTILGLRDIMDDADSTISEWRTKQVYEVLDQYYSEIWVYGLRELYDPIAEYQIPERISEKMIFTGYIPRLAPNGKDLRRGELGGCAQKLVLVTTGGGGDGYPLMDAYLRMLEPSPVQDFQTVMVTGPFMPKAQRKDVARRAKRLGIKFYHFYRRMEQLIAAADLVVSMGGYNTICEILTHKKVSLIVPRETPRLEQRIRAEVLKFHNLIDFIPWSELRPERLQERIPHMLADSAHIRSAVGAFRMSGFETMRERLTVCSTETS